MDPVQIYYLFQQQPFPFRVHLRDGRKYDIATREFVVVGVTFLEIGFQAANGPEGVWGTSIPVSLSDIARLEPLNTGTTQPTH